MKEEESGALFYVPVGDKGWYLAAVPENTILKTTQDTVFFTMLAAAGICTLLSMAAAYFISRGLTHNIKHLKDIMERTGAGNLELRYQGKSRDEVDYLGKTYNKMLDDIRAILRRIRKSRNKSSSERSGSFRRRSTRIFCTILWMWLFFIWKKVIWIWLCRYCVP